MPVSTPDYVDTAAQAVCKANGRTMKGGRPVDAWGKVMGAEWSHACKVAQAVLDASPRLSPAEAQELHENVSVALKIVEHYSPEAADALDRALELAAIVVADIDAS